MTPKTLRNLKVKFIVSRRLPRSWSASGRQSREPGHLIVVQGSQGVLSWAPHHAQSSTPTPGSMSDSASLRKSHHQEVDERPPHLRNGRAPTTKSPAWVQLTRLLGPEGLVHPTELALRGCQSRLQHSRGDAAGSAHPSREARGTAPPASAPGSTGTLPLADPVGGFGTREIVPGATTVHAGTVLLEEVVGFLGCPETGRKKEWAERGMSKGSTGTWGR